MKRVLDKWEALGTGSGIAAGVARMVVYALLLFLAFECVTIDFNWSEQGVLGILTIALTFALNSISESELITLALMFASMLATARYAYWRFVTVYQALTSPNHHVFWLDIILMLILLSAELYAWMVLYLGYIQSARPLRRPPVPLPRSLEEWPHVDLLIPTYNEPLAVVRSTAFAALNIDYPPEKLHVYVLDDGRREAFRDFCRDAGVGYITRPDNKHAKAGNINHALKELASPYVAIFDCDHVPTRSFLQVTLGWFQRDAKLGMLQTPHFFYSPDPFERNLNQFMSIPNEGELFYGILQDGNDLWNATFFCGSCAVLRRKALDEIGGIATETVTEDAHTSLRMQMRGWGTAYINIPQAAGLATESLSSHVGQRIRWARGMIQILRTDNPVFVKGLKWPQRLCYFNAMIHFLYAVPRLVFLTAPLVFMLLGRINIPGYWIAILAYALPHLFLSNVTNYRIQGKYRYSFWNEVYETILAPYILGPTIFALINPKLGKFNVTAKGGIVRKSFFDFNIARPYLILLYLNFLGLAIAPFRFFFWNADHPGTIVMNVVWILFNLVIVGTANAVAMESRQLRKDVRIELHRPVEVQIPGRPSVFGESADMSLGGASVTLEEPIDVPPGTPLRLIYPLRRLQASLPATVVGAQSMKLRVQYDPLSLEEEEMLTLVLFSGADTWLTRAEKRQTDRPLRSFGRLMILSVRGVKYALLALIPRRKAREELASAGARAALILAAMLLAAPALNLHAQAKRAAAGAEVAEAGEGSFHSTLSFRDAGIPDTIELQGLMASRSVPFTLPYTEVVQKATLHLHYSFSPGLIAELSHLNVLLNGTLISSLPAPAAKDDRPEQLSANLELPAELLARTNVLTLQFAGHYAQSCEDPANPALRARVGVNSALDLAGSLLPLADDLKLLPLPFFDSEATGSSASVPFVFLRQPSTQALTAAGVLASWLGVRAKSKPLEFPVTEGPALPGGNVILLIENPDDVPRGLDVDAWSPVVAIRPNPGDPFGKVLVVAGSNASQLLAAARAVALEVLPLEGRTVPVPDFAMPPPRQADDAPYWLSAERASPLWPYAANEEASDASGPLPVYLRIPPDLYYGDRTSIALHVDYSYNASQVPQSARLQVDANGSTVGELPLAKGDEPKTRASGVVDIPLENLRPFANTFLFSFLFQPPKPEHCQVVPAVNLQGGIRRTSWLQLNGLHHWAIMPDLELFANAGFPFTRYADLSQTRVVLPSQPSPQEIGVYLTLLAYFGSQTGFPAVRVQVGDSSTTGKDADYLVLGTSADQPALQQLNQHLPVAVDGDGFSVTGSGSIVTAAEHLWWQIAEMRPKWWGDIGASKDRAALVGSLAEVPDALVQGIQSPWNANRSVVSITFHSNESASTFATSFIAASASGDIGQSVSVLHGRNFASYRIGDEVYYIGHLQWYSLIRYRLRQFPWLIVVLTFVLGLFVVPWAQARLDRRVQARLEARET
ncbi:MAG TPA: UDP-forming cellulose synthase catalytic subunit [Acidobacteriaceae bacterium]|jgi:cellulose synthase (UDP-forming)|nr:UDP-forming cellulose synthase catalytic subunit [Acidobacteriaceae bacterium]